MTSPGLPRYYCPKCKDLIATEYEAFLRKIKDHAEKSPRCKKWFLRQQEEWEKRHGKTPAPTPPLRMTAGNKPPDPDALEARVLRGMKKPKGEGQ